MRDFLDGELSADELDVTKARFRVIPVPLERTVSYGAGTGAGPEAILEASVELERLFRGAEPCAQGISTEDAVDCFGPLPEVMGRIANRTGAAVAEGRIPVTLGGEHSLTYGAFRGVAAAAGAPVGIVQIDAHADMRFAYQGERHSHASVMRLLAEEDGVHIAQYGVRAFSQEELDARGRLGVHYIDAEELVTANTLSVKLPDEFPELVYVSFDVDGLDPSILPATGTPVPGGLGYWQALKIVETALQGRRMIGCDVVELAPNGDSMVSDFTTAQIVYALMAMA
ncbi:agmatinase [Qingshengfaniella alkalisoli]|uniref:Agmatinase n=1 Tax=Qingshengfaniella alkalisoli TaxID=2599296 RepID=A0A5B8JAH0_9RHOB|nr:agmatinase [Qingshengfaniella alkalisoli]QDY71297.1 agmatinase [Qingshengfaniella alkalisoli]